MKKPNILFILTDDQRYDTIHRNGNCDIITPNIDSLTEDGTSFCNTYIEGGFTGAVCMPSRGMINTSKHLCNLSGLGENVPKDHTLLGECLKNNGYYCFGTGKWHNGPPAFTRSFDEGDNIFFGGMWDHWNVPVNNYDPLGNYDNEINFVANFFNDNKKIKIHCDKFNPGIHSTDLLTDTMENFIKNYDKDQPFFGYLAYLAPHDPRTMPEKYSDLYNDKDIKLPKSSMEEYPVNYEGYGMRDEDLTPYPRTLERNQQELKDYYAMITHIDEQIGKLIEVLKEKDIYDDTIIVLCGDNGLGLGNHAFMGKQNHYEHSIKVPLVIKGPNVPKDMKVSSQVFLTDVYPTLCDLVNIKKPESVEGESFVDCLKDKDKAKRTEMYYILMDRTRTIRKDQYKLSVYITPSDTYSIVLYDIEKDPDELNDLSRQQPEMVKSLLKELLKQKEINENLDRIQSKVFWTKFNELIKL